MPVTARLTTVTKQRTGGDEAAAALRLAEARRRRRRGLLNHMIAYFAVMVVLVPVNALTTPERPWFLLPMVAWGAPLAVHTAWVMGLFGAPKA